MPTLSDVRAQFPQYDNLSDTELAGKIHDKFYSNMDPDVFAEKIGLKPPDPVSVNDIGRSLATGVPVIGGLMNKANAATNAALAPALNSFFDEKDQLPEATFGERYAHSLRDQEGMDAKFASQHPIVNTAGNLVGGVAGMIPTVAAAPGLFGATGGLATRIGMGTASNALLGGTDAAVRGADPVTGAIVGGVLGATAPVTEAALSPVVSNITARINPERYAQRQVARAVSESGQTPTDLIDRLTGAAADGQSQFTLADALGNPGQRMLAATTRGPGEGATLTTNALENRQAGQGRRVANTLSEGFGSRMTPDQLREAMTAERGAIADEAYGAVRQEAAPVDVRNVVDHIDANVPTEPAAPDSISGRLQRYRRMLTNGDDENPQFLNDFEHAQRVRSEMADEIQNARQNGQGNRARMLGQALRELDTSLESASPGFRQANADFAAATRNIEAIDAGRTAALRGRTENTIPEFQGLGPRAQQAYRTGYADPLIEAAQGSAPGVNKVRPLLNDAMRDEAAAIAPGNDLMQRRLAREQTMFETRGRALGNSKTAENLADDAAMGLNPTTIMNIAHGNWGGAIGSLIQAGTNAATGNTPAVRAAVARILLQNGATMNAAALNQMVSRTIGQLQFLETLARSGTAAAVTTTNQATRKPSIFKRQETK